MKDGKYEEGDIVKVILTEKLPGNTIAPPLKMDEERVVIGTTTCRCGKQHLDLGLMSKFSFIGCVSCREDLKDGAKIHWCHPSRVELVK